MSDQMETARAEATQEVCSAVLKAAGEVMKVHGNDPHGGVILAAGFAMALKAIGEHIDRKVPLTVYEILAPAKSR